MRAKQKLGERRLKLIKIDAHEMEVFDFYCVKTMPKPIKLHKSEHKVG